MCVTFQHNAVQFPNKVKAAKALGIVYFHQMRLVFMAFCMPHYIYPEDVHYVKREWQHAL